MSQAAYRAAAVTLMTECAADANVTLQVYKARPASLYPPTGFIDGMGDEIGDHFGTTVFQHRPVIELVMVWGLFDSAEAVDQRDAWVDAFHEWVRVRFHAAGARSLIQVRSLTDVPDFVPNWVPEEQQRVYYATRITMGGDTTD